MPKLSDKITESYSNLKIRFTHFIVIAGTAEYLTYQYQGNPLYHLSGAVSNLIFRAVDHISTLPTIKLMNTEEAKEKNISDKFYETSFLLKENPK